MVRTLRAGRMPFETQGKLALPVCGNVWEKPQGSADSALHGGQWIGAGAAGAATMRKGGHPNYICLLCG